MQINTITMAISNCPDGEAGGITAALFGFLAIAPNAEVGAMNPNAMPVTLATP